MRKIKDKTKDKINDAMKNWVSNAAGFNYVAIDKDGSVWIYNEKPGERIADWSSNAASIKIGCTTNWTLIKNWRYTLTEINKPKNASTKKKKSSELKSCPFCGGEQIGVFKSNDKKIKFSCLSCGCCTDWYNNEKEAKEHWNSRVE